MPNVTPLATWSHVPFPHGPSVPLHLTAFEVVPYPIVSLLKIKNDILFTLTGSKNPHWKIDPVFIQVPGPWLGRNNHILGYHPSETLTLPQVDTLLAAGLPMTEAHCESRFRTLRRVRP